MKNSKPVLNLIAISHHQNELPAPKNIKDIIRFHLSHEDEPVLIEHLKADDFILLLEQAQKTIQLVENKITQLKEIEPHLNNLARYFAILDLGNKKWFEFHYVITQASYESNNNEIKEVMVWQIQQAGASPVLTNPQKMNRAKLLMLLYDNKVSTALIDDEDYPEDIVLGQAVCHAKHEERHIISVKGMANKTHDELPKVAPL
jgi:hypothetical protein